ncbi:MAG: BACON domain-containing protein [Prevotella sp.]|nr:BACON domain-containing protein [Prevotella sp.]
MKKKNFFWSLLAIVMASTLNVVFVSCHHDPKLDVSGNGKDYGIVLDAEGTQIDASITVSTERTDWDVTINDSWLHASKNGSSLWVSADKNESTSERKGTITIFAKDDNSIKQTLNVSQKAADPYILVDGVKESDREFQPDESGSTSKQKIKIKSNVEWQIGEMVDWLNVSPSRGNGEVDMEIFPKNVNNSSDVRIAYLDLKYNGEILARIKISQDGMLAKDCEVTPTNIITLYNGIAFDYNFGKNVSYYYRGYMLKSRVGSMSDEEIIDTLETRFKDNRSLPSDDEVGTFDGLEQGTTYMVYTLGYNKDGVRGNLKKTEITTKKLQNNEPLAWISDVTTDNTNWYWSIEKSATCNSYYMITTENYDFAVSADVFQAWMIDYYKRRGQISEYVNGGSFYRSKSYVLLAVMTWGIDRNGNFANRISWNYGIDSSSSSKRISQKKESKYVNKNYRKIGEDQLKVYRMR